MEMNVLNRIPCLLCLLLLALILSCDRQSSSPSKPTSSGPSSPSLSKTDPFPDRAKEWGIHHQQASGRKERTAIFESLGSGVAVFDANGDGLLDLFFNNAATVEKSGDALKFLPGPGCRFYLQKKKGQFVDHTQEAGLSLDHWGTGVAVGDIDNDGDADLFVGAFGKNHIFTNQGNGTFKNHTDASGLKGEKLTSSAVFFDYDLDGDLDLYVANYLKFDLNSPPNNGKPCLQNGIPISCSPTLFDPEDDRLYRNDGKGTFEDVTSQAKLTGTVGGYGLGVVAGDLDRDGHPDLYVANDTTSNFLWKNLGDGTFEDIALFSGTALSESAQGQSGMGVDLGDLDGDGYLDIHVTNYAEESNAYYKSLGDGTFVDRSHLSGIASDSFPYLGWGSRIIDFNHDGYLDMAVANGHVHPRAEELGNGSDFAQPTQIYWGSTGGKMKLWKTEKDWALTVPRNHRALASGDLDRDGDLDIILTHLDSPPVILVNQAAEGDWIGFKLQGKKSNREGIGARITLKAGDRVWVKEVTRGGSYLSSNEATSHFGLGKNKTVLEVTIEWPSGIKTRLTTLPANKVYLVEEIKGSAKAKELFGG